MTLYMNSWARVYQRPTRLHRRTRKTYPTYRGRLRSIHPKKAPTTCRSSFPKTPTATPRWIRPTVTNLLKTTICQDGRSQGNWLDM